MKPQPIQKPDEQPTPPWLKNYIPLPGDPAKLTLEDVRAAFAGDWSALKEVIEVAKEVQRRQTVPVTD